MQTTVTISDELYAQALEMADPGMEKLNLQNDSGTYRYAGLDRALPPAKHSAARPDYQQSGDDASFRAGETGLRHTAGAACTHTPLSLASARSQTSSASRCNRIDRAGNAIRFRLRPGRYVFADFDTNDAGGPVMDTGQAPVGTFQALCGPALTLLHSAKTLNPVIVRAAVAIPGTSPATISA